MDFSPCNYNCCRRAELALDQPPVVNSDTGLSGESRFRLVCYNLLS